jgi:hypothetical protein
MSTASQHSFRFATTNGFAGSAVTFIVHQSPKTVAEKQSSVFDFCVSFVGTVSIIAVSSAKAKETSKE